MLRSAFAGLCLALSAQPPAHVWELQEIELRASRPYANSYVEVECWVELKGPGFSTRVYGYWDGGDVFRVRLVATAPGQWSWTSGSNQPADAGLSGKRGGFAAREWTEEEKQQNANRRGFLRPDAQGHALQYADGTPFFLLGDTWLGAATWRLPLTEMPADPRYEAEPGVTFQQAVALLHLVRPSRGCVAGIDGSSVGRRRRHAAAALPRRAGRGGHGLGGEDRGAIGGRSVSVASRHSRANGRDERVDRRQAPVGNRCPLVTGRKSWIGDRS